MPAQLSIVITRPAEQNLALQKQLSSLGANCFSFPCIEIEPLALSQDDLPCSLEDIDLLIFISPNAARIAFTLFPKLSTSGLNQCLFAAVGNSTATVLAKLGAEKIITPATSQDSAGLLAVPELQDIQNRNVLIIKGVGGKLDLYNILAKRGTRVFTIDVYQRSLPEKTAIPFSKQVDLLLFTSGESVENFLQLIPDYYRNPMLNCQTIVGHPNIGAKVSSLGFKKLPIIASSPSDRDMLSCIETWARRLENQS